MKPINWDKPLELRLMPNLAILATVLIPNTSLRAVVATPNDNGEVFTFNVDAVTGEYKHNHDYDVLNTVVKKQSTAVWLRNKSNPKEVIIRSKKIIENTSAFFKNRYEVIGEYTFEYVEE